jgi:hypothetical protein
MPGVGDYTEEEIRSMSVGELSRAQENGFSKQTVTRLRPEEVRLIASPGADAQVNVQSSVPERVTQPPVDDSDGRNVWKRKKSGGDDFTCPSGQKCRLRPLQLEKLMMEGILDQVTRLEGLAQAFINRAEGLPPEQQKMPSREEFADLLGLINKIIPMAVAEPHVYPDDYTDPVPEDAISVSDIDLMDRVAILDEALGGLKAMDNFRKP